MALLQKSVSLCARESMRMLDECRANSERERESGETDLGTHCTGWSFMPSRFVMLPELSAIALRRAVHACRRVVRATEVCAHCATHSRMCMCASMPTRMQVKEKRAPCLSQLHHSRSRSLPIHIRPALNNGLTVAHIYICHCYFHCPKKSLLLLRSVSSVATDCLSCGL